MGVKVDKAISKVNTSPRYLYKKDKANSLREWYDFTRYRHNIISLFNTYTVSYPASSKSDFLIWIKDDRTAPTCNKMVNIYRKLLNEETWSTWSPDAIVNSLLRIAIESPAIDDSPVAVIYRNRGLIEVSLTSHDKYTLNKVIMFIKITSQKDNWPLNRLEIELVDDSEVENWQYILIMMYFDSDFDTADMYIHDFYNEMDILINTLDDMEQDILQRRIFFDVGTTVSHD